ncbi:MAG: hypothetical protein ABI877_22030, partial [Gemmatimonadaceae bacterium]
MNTLFEFLFKYPRVMYERGTLAFATGVPAWTVVLFGVAVALVAIWAYLRPSGQLRGYDRVLLGAMRTIALALVFFCLLRPVLSVA